MSAHTDFLAASSAEEVERTPLNLGAITPHAERTPAVPPRTREWRADDQDDQKKRSGNYGAGGYFNLAARAQRADKSDCRICDEPAADPVRALCCGAVFCRDHLRDWIHGPAASPNCPACTAICVLPTGALGPKPNRRPHTTAMRSASRFAVEQTRRVATLLDRFNSLILAVLVVALLVGVVIQQGHEQVDAPENDLGVYAEA